MTRTHEIVVDSMRTDAGWVYFARCTRCGAMSAGRSSDAEARGSLYVRACEPVERGPRRTT